MATRTLIGAHMPTAGGLHNAIVNGHEIGCTAVQVFTSSPRQWKPKEITDEAAAAFKEACSQTGINSLISHDSYLINLAAGEPSLRSKSQDALVAEMERCAKLGIPYAVSHMGAHTGDGEAEGLRRLTVSAAEVLKRAPESVSIAMETTAGTGTSLGYQFEHLAEVIEGNKNDKRLVVCMDTCHIFAAGYDIRTEDAYNATMEEFDRLVGLNRLVCVHTNDSLKPFGSRKDRHAHIGQGEIGEEAFRLLVNDARIPHVPIVVETPDAESMHEVNVRKLRSLLS